MRLAFDATDFGFESDQYALVCGLSGRDVAGQPHYLTFSRDPEGKFEDWGVHLEYDDQCHGGYERVSRCELGREALRVDLSGQLGGLKGISGFDVAIHLDDELMEQLRSGLRQVFRGKRAVLVEIA